MSKIVEINPIFNCLIVKQIEAKEKTESGIYIPETSQKKPNLGKVLKVGPDCKSDVKVGDFIVLPKNLGITTNIEVNGEEVIIIKEENVIGIIKINDNE